MRPDNKSIRLCCRTCESLMLNDDDTVWCVRGNECYTCGECLDKKEGENALRELGLKVCPRCGKAKPEGAYYSRKAAYCRDCVVDARRAERALKNDAL